MIHIDLDLSMPSRANPVLSTAVDVSEAIRAALAESGAVVHRITVEEIDA